MKHFRDVVNQSRALEFADSSLIFTSLRTCPFLGFYIVDYNLLPALKYAVQPKDTKRKCSDRMACHFRSASLQFMTGNRSSAK